MRASSLANNPLAVTRELDGRYDVVLEVRDNLDLIEQVAGIDFEAILAELESAQDFTGITVVQGETVAWDAVNKLLTVPKGDKGDKGDTGDTGLTGPQGIQGPQGIKGDAGLKGDTGSQGPKGFDGENGVQGLKGDTGDDLTITQITYNGNGTFNWLFSDGTTYVTPDLRGPKGDTGDQGIKGDQGISVHHLKGTSTTNPTGDFGVSPFKDTYTFYGDANETTNLGWFVIANGVSDGMSASVYDTNGNGIVDNSERLDGELPSHYVNVSTNQTISGNKTFTSPVAVNTISIGGHAVSWNTDESTLDVVLNGATLQVGQEQLIRVTNNSGVAVNNGTAVMATGTLGNSGRITIAKANLTNVNARMILGVVTETIASGADGFVTAFGKVRGIQTNGANYGETWVDGDVLYVKDSGNGALTKVVPTNAQVKLPVAIVVSSHGTNGTLFVRVNSIDENHAKVELASKITRPASTTHRVVKFSDTNGSVVDSNLVSNSMGDLGLNVSPSLWHSSVRALETAAGALFNYSGTKINLIQNAYQGLDGVYRYKSNAPATLLTEENGEFKFSTAPSGVTEASATFTERMKLDNAGVLTVATAAVGTNTTQVATTAYVIAEINKIEEW